MQLISLTGNFAGIGETGISEFSRDYLTFRLRQNNDIPQTSMMDIELLFHYTSMVMDVIFRRFWTKHRVVEHESVACRHFFRWL